MIRTFLLALTVLLGGAGTLRAAAPDNNIEWYGVSHVSWQDLRPLCPLAGESFQVRFQTYANDITSARLRVDDGGIGWIDAAVVDSRGPYDIWAGQVPATASDTLSYYIELTDGTDTDYYSVSGMSEGEPTDGGFVLDFSTLAHAPFGATLASGGGAVFKVWSPTQPTAHVRGEFNGWGTGNPMTRVGEYFTAYVPDAGDRQMYKYFFANSHWNTDARGRSLNPSDNLNAYIEDPDRYVWQVDDFETPPIEEMVIYQLHVGTFAGRNDPYGSTPFPSRYVDVADRASHLAELGINVVMLNPITEFPGDLSAGYNPQTMWAPEWKYGDPDDLKLMIDTLHENGIAVLLDIVWNHFTINDNFMWYYDGTQIYFDDPAVDTPWGAQADFDRGPVREYFVQSALHWLEEYHVDGFRMDGTDYMNIPPQEAAGWSLMQWFNDTIDNRWVDKVTIAEQLPDDPYVTRPTSLDGAGFDAQYHDAFADRLREEILDAAWGDPEMWKIQNIINGSGAFLNGRYVLNYLELHDEAWPASGGQRLVKTIDQTFPHDDIWAKGRIKLGHGLVLTAPGIPAFLMGDEWLEDTDFGTDSGNRIDWSKKVTYAPIFDYFRDIVSLRTTNPALKADAPHQVFHLNETGNVIAFQRYDFDGNVLVVVANFSNDDYTTYRIGLPLSGPWGEILNSQASEYDGNGLSNPNPFETEPIPADGFDQSAEISVAQMALIVLQHDPGSSDVPGDSGSIDGSLRLKRVFPNPTLGGTSIEYQLDRPARMKLTIHDVSGRLVSTLLDRFEPAGGGVRVWNGRDRRGEEAATGIYVVRLESGGRITTRKFALVR